MRALPLIKATIDKKFIHKQKESIRLVNNFDYYLAHGDFHTKLFLLIFKKICLC